MRCTILNTYARMHEDIRPRECFTHRYQDRQVEVCTYDGYIFSCLTYTQTHKHVHRHVHIRQNTHAYITIYTCIHTRPIFLSCRCWVKNWNGTWYAHTQKSTCSYTNILSTYVYSNDRSYGFNFFVQPQVLIMAGKIIGSARIASRSRFKRSTIDGEGKKQIVSALRVILQAEPLAAG